jgi:hypothetical protein
MPNPSELVDRLISATPDWRGATLAKLRRIIHNSDPAITEELKWRRPSNPLGAPVWQRNGIVCVGSILKERVRLTFFAGASLPDPNKLFNARLDSRTARAIDFYEGDKLNQPALRALILAGVEYNLASKRPSRSRKK